MKALSIHRQISTGPQTQTPPVAMDTLITQNCRIIYVIGQIFTLEVIDLVNFNSTCTIGIWSSWGDRLTTKVSVHIRYVTLLWALPTPKKNFAGQLD